MESTCHSSPLGMKLIKVLYGLRSFVGNQLDVLVFEGGAK
jgi:hypothetical protein